MLRHSESTEILDIREARAGESAWEVGRQLLWLGPCSLEEKEKEKARSNRQLQKSSICAIAISMLPLPMRRDVGAWLQP